MSKKYIADKFQVIGGTSSEFLLADGTVTTNAGNVDSVNGQTGVVSLDTDDVPEGSTNEYYTEAKVSANTDVAANTAKNTYPSADATKLSGIAAGAEVNVQSDWNATTGDGFILNKPTTITSTQASDILTNNAKISNVAHPLVETAVPSGAVFTDTVYDDTTIQAEVDLNTAKVSNIAHPLVETAVPSGAVFTDTVYDDTTIQAEVDLNTAKVSNVSTNITIVESASTVAVQSSDGTNDSIAAATTSLAGVMTASDKTKLDSIQAGAQVNGTETVTSISIAANVLTYTDENGTDTDIDLSTYLDDTNLARLTSGSLNSSTGIATFTRDDASTFTIDMSAFLDAITLNNTLTSTSTTEGLTAAQGKVLKDLIDGLEATDSVVLTRLPYWQYVLPSTTDSAKCGVGINVHSDLDTTVTFQILVTATTSTFVNRAFIASGTNSIKDIPYSLSLIHI